MGYSEGKERTMPGPSALCVEVSESDRATLERWIRCQTTDKRLYLRGKLVLLAAEGYSNSAIAEKLDFPRSCIVDWRRRFVEEGLDGLSDRPRSGRPRLFSPSGTTCHRRPCVHASR